MNGSHLSLTTNQSVNQSQHTCVLKADCITLEPVKPKFHYANFATFTETSLLGKSCTQITKVCDTNHIANFRDLCPQQSPQTSSPTFPVHCNEPNSIRATETGLLRTCHRLCRKHLDMSRFFCLQLSWFTSATFTETSWFVTVCVCDFRDLCPRLSLRGSFDESRRNGIWAYANEAAVTYFINAKPLSLKTRTSWMLPNWPKWSFINASSGTQQAACRIQFTDFGRNWQLYKIHQCCNSLHYNRTAALCHAFAASYDTTKLFTTDK